jgi:hypothetical protein
MRDAPYWVEAVADAYSSLTTVEAMRDSLEDWKAAVVRDRSDLAEIISMVERPGGELPALISLIKHYRARENR